MNSLDVNIIDEKEIDGANVMKQKYDECQKNIIFNMYQFFLMDLLSIDISHLNKNNKLNDLCKSFDFNFINEMKKEYNVTIGIDAQYDHHDIIMNFLNTINDNSIVNDMLFESHNNLSILSYISIDDITNPYTKNKLKLMEKYKTSLLYKYFENGEDVYETQNMMLKHVKLDKSRSIKNHLDMKHNPNPWDNSSESLLAVYDKNTKIYKSKMIPSINLTIEKLDENVFSINYCSDYMLVELQNQSHSYVPKKNFIIVDDGNIINLSYNNDDFYYSKELLKVFKYITSNNYYVVFLDRHVNIETNETNTILKCFTIDINDIFGETYAHNNEHDELTTKVCNYYLDSHVDDKNTFTLIDCDDKDINCFILPNAIEKTIKHLLMCDNNIYIILNETNNDNQVKIIQYDIMKKQKNIHCLKMTLKNYARIFKIFPQNNGLIGFLFGEKDEYAGLSSLEYIFAVYDLKNQNIIKKYTFVNVNGKVPTLLQLKNNIILCDQSDEVKYDKKINNQHIIHVRCMINLSEKHDIYKMNLGNAVTRMAYKLSNTVMEDTFW
jgi:hypothetical protein